MAKRRSRRRGFMTRLLLGLLGAAVQHGRKQARKAAARAAAPKVIRRASDEYGAKRKAGTPIPECPLNPPTTEPTPVWEFEAMVGHQHVTFTLVEDSSITALDETEMITYALLAACHQNHNQRPIDEAWPVTWIAATNEAARAHFGNVGQRPAMPGMDRT